LYAVRITYNIQDRSNEEHAHGREQRRLGLGERSLSARVHLDGGVLKGVVAVLKGGLT
jgi:hypothetical protein